MDEEQLKKLGEKVGNHTATPEEELSFITELNSITAEMRSDVEQLAQENN